MTDTKKTGLTLTALVAAVIAVAGVWPHVVPALTWAAPIFAREQVQAVLASLAGGVALGAWLPHLLPSGWPPARTRLVAGALCALLTLAVALALVPTRIGLVYAVLAAIASPTVAQLLAGLLYLLKPCARPASLKP